MKKHFVVFCSPGTFTSETTMKEVESWDVEQAKTLARDIKERHGAVPFGFKFITRGRSEDELDSKVIDQSHMYYLGGKVETIEEIFLRQDPNEETLRWNMKTNGYDRVLVNTNSWKVTLPLEKDDVVLEWNKD